MKKDVIYIDTEDDITAIIGKIKDSKEKIVALVPPKRIGVLQSAVNLRLLSRVAIENNKRLVLVTNNKALINLSSVADIPIAKSLQSKPEVIKIDELINDDVEDIIDGERLSVGELMKTADEPIDIKITPERKESVNDIIDEIDIDEDAPNSKTTYDTKNHETIELPTKKVKVPDFVKFRTFLFIGIVALIGLIGFLYWAIVHAPSAEVIISAKTEKESVSVSLKLTNETNIDANTIKITPKELKKDLSVTFDATGEKNTGNRASGIISIENCDSVASFTISAGTIFTSSSGHEFTNDSTVTVPGLTDSASKCQLNGSGAGVAEVAVTAVNPGEQYNISSKTYEIDGVEGYVYASGGSMTGGSTKISPVVTKEDIEKATASLKELSTDSAKKQLIKEFTEDYIVVNESYLMTYGDFISTPDIDQESTGKAILKSSTTFKVSAIEKTDLEKYLDGALKEKINPKTEKIYDNGINSVKLSGYVSNEEGITLRATTSGKVGPSLSKEFIIDQIKGKKFGNAQSTILSMPGVSDTEIKFSYFWVKTIPNDTKKIDIRFILDDGEDS